MHQNDSQRKRSTMLLRSATCQRVKIPMKMTSQRNSNDANRNRLPLEKWTHFGDILDPNNCVTNLTLNTNKLHNPDRWWAKHKAAHPRIALIAQTYLGMNGSSTVSERAFSKCGFVTTGRRNGLSGKMLEATLFLNSCSKVPWIWKEVTMQPTRPTKKGRKVKKLVEDAEKVKEAQSRAT